MFTGPEVGGVPARRAQLQSPRDPGCDDLPPMSAEIAFTAAPVPRRVLDALGRTEDLHFSPSGQRLAVASFLRNRIAVFDVAIDAQTRGVHLSGAIELRGAALSCPHGLCFLDERTLVVANREGGVHVIDAPASTRSEGDVVVAVELRQTLIGSPAVRIETPGSVAAHRLDDSLVEVLVCNNYGHQVTRHVLDARRDYACVSDELLLARRLKVPDGICISGDGRWIALSNHDTHSVLLYDRAAGGVGPASLPHAVLRDVMCPHGLRFTADQAHVLVADASAPHVNVYARKQDGWHGTHDPIRFFGVMSEATFRRGRHNPEEGGPKGIDFAMQVGLLAITCESRPLAFFDLADVLERQPAPRARRRHYLLWRLERSLHRLQQRFGAATGVPT